MQSPGQLLPYPVSNAPKARLNRPLRAKKWFAMHSKYLFRAFPFFVLGSMLWASSGLFPGPAQAAYTDAAASWDKAGLRTAAPTPIQTVSVLSYGAKGDGVTDDTLAFQNALSAMSHPGVLSIPEGAYRITATLDLTSGTVLSGAGSGKSKLIFNLSGAADPCIDFTTYNSRSWVNLSQTATAGSSTVTVASASGFTVGSWVEIEQQNDAAKMYTDPAWNVDWAQNVVGQFAKITAVSGATLTLDRPLRSDYQTSLAAHIRVYVLGHDVGIEDLALTREDASTGGGDIIHFKYAQNCWVRRVESTWTVGSHVYAESSAAIEVTDSTFKFSHDYGGSGRGYGVSLGRHVSDCLVQNNAFDTLRHAMIVSQGANGNVYAYNYSVNTVCETTTWTPCDISVHGHFPFRNLFEGNIVQEIDDTDYWGPAGPKNVFLRNVVQREGIEIMDASNDQAVIGNVVKNNAPLTVATGITGTVLTNNVSSGTSMVSVSSDMVPASLFRASAPSYFGTLVFPMLADGQEINAAMSRYTTLASNPPVDTSTATPGSDPTDASTLASVTPAIMKVAPLLLP